MKKSTWFGVILGMALVFTGVAVKSETIIGVHTISHHTSGDWNNNNPGVYVSHNGWTAGTYYNSERHQTVYAGYTFAGPIIGPLHWGLSVGAASGYERSKIVPMVVPSLAFNTDVLTVRLSGVPPVAGSAGVFHLSFEKKF